MYSYKEATRHALERASSPISPAHIADAGSEEDLEEDPKEYPANYLADEGDDIDEPSEDDADEEDEEEASKEEDDDEEEEHLVLVDSSFVPTIDHVPLAKDTKTFKTDESAPTPVPSPRQISISCADLALIRRISFAGYGVLEARIEDDGDNAYVYWLGFKVLAMKVKQLVNDKDWETRNRRSGGIEDEILNDGCVDKNGDEGFVEEDMSNIGVGIGLNVNNESAHANIDSSGLKTSFFKVVKPTLISHGNKLSLIPNGVEEGRDVVIFEEELVEEGRTKGTSHKMECFSSNSSMRKTARGISSITSSLGKPLIMDKVTTQTCNEGTGKLGYARVLVVVNAKNELDKIKLCYKDKNNVTIGTKYVGVEYAWKPPKCSHYAVLGHEYFKCEFNPERLKKMSTKRTAVTMTVNPIRKDLSKLRNTRRTRQKGMET
nr:hypothetical protein [Tanacetum cinerariifolium]